jgi:hypothetical protein
MSDRLEHLPGVDEHDNSICEVQNSFETDHTSDPLYYTPTTRIIADDKVAPSILCNSTSYTSTWGAVVRELSLQEHGIGGSVNRATEQPKILRQTTIEPANSTKDVFDLRYQTTTNFVHSKSYKLRGVYEVYTFQNIAELSRMKFVVRFVSISLKDSPIPKDLVNDEELYAMMITVFRYVYPN